MWIDIHAVLLIIFPFAAVAAIVLLRRRTPGRRECLFATMWVLLAMFLVSHLNHHLCHEGTPQSQWSISGICMLPILVWLKSAAWRRVIAGALFVGMLGLSCHYTDVVHQSAWTGNREWGGIGPVFLNSVCRSAEGRMGSLQDPETACGAGWLRELPVWEELGVGFGNRYPSRREILPVWHSRLTGLYRCTEVRQDFWYPGGPFEQNIANIELRDRPKP